MNSQSLAGAQWNVPRETQRLEDVHLPADASPETLADAQEADNESRFQSGVASRNEPGNSTRRTGQRTNGKHDLLLASVFVHSASHGETVSHFEDRSNRRWAEAGSRVPNGGEVSPYKFLSGAH
jgi:hypothetical protein